MEHASNDHRGVSTQKTDVQSAPDPLRDKEERSTVDIIRASFEAGFNAGWDADGTPLTFTKEMQEAYGEYVLKHSEQLLALSVDRRERVIAPQLDTKDKDHGAARVQLDNDPAKMSLSELQRRYRLNTSNAMQLQDDLRGGKIAERSSADNT